MEGAVIALACRTSDRDARGSEGAVALAAELAARLATQARTIGSPGEARTGGWEDDLRDSRGCLLEAGGQLEDALSDGRYPVLTASDCSICLATLPLLARLRPDADVLWLDAHGDFNTPETTPSGFLGGMCLAGACGQWDTGFGGDLDPARVMMCGVRDVDAGERVLLDMRGVGLVLLAVGPGVAGGRSTAVRAPRPRRAGPRRAARDVPGAGRPERWRAAHAAGRGGRERGARRRRDHVDDRPRARPAGGDDRRAAAAAARVAAERP